MELVVSQNDFSTRRNEEREKHSKTAGRESLASASGTTPPTHTLASSTAAGRL